MFDEDLMFMGFYDTFVYTGNTEIDVVSILSDNHPPIIVLYLLFCSFFSSTFSLLLPSALYGIYMWK